ncbi:MAG: hypothetical protein EXS10_07720 [Phycisphaerales bacterium]|nr:hypothetical protein [Phycisphaerales bacterium]
MPFKSPFHISLLRARPHARAIALTLCATLTMSLSALGARAVHADDSKIINHVDEREATAFARAAVRNNGIAEFSVDEFRELELGDTVVFPLADGVEVGMTLVEKRWLNDGPSVALGAALIYEWQFREESALATAAMVLVNGELSGEAHSGELGARYHALGRDSQSIEPFTDMGDCGGAFDVPFGGEAKPHDPTLDAHALSTDDDAPAEGGVAGGCTDSAALIDIAIFYNTDVPDVAGGVNAAESQIAAAVANLNSALASSRCNTRMRVVALESTGRSSAASLFDDLDWVRTNAGIATRRNELGADMVHIVSTGSGVCGVASLFNNSPASAFGATSFGCLGGYTLAHEVGHNFGCCHAPGDGGGCGTGGYYPYSVGYRFTGTTGTLWRTVMAYDPGARIAHFSNPSVSYDGAATGLPGNAPGVGANNARTINLTAGSIAQFRCSGGTQTDCNGNSIDDQYELDTGAALDCNANGIPDSCDIASGLSLDVNSNGVPDECPLASPVVGSLDPDILDTLGWSVSIDARNADPFPYLIAGEPHDDAVDGSIDAAGAAIVYARVGTTWGGLAVLRPSDPRRYAQFGSSVAMFKRQGAGAVPSANLAVVGAYRAQATSGANWINEGAAYSFEETGTGWVQKHRIIPQAITPDTTKTNAYFGFSVAMSRIGTDSGDQIFVGAPGSNLGKGSMYVFRQNDTGTIVQSGNLRGSTTTLLGDDVGWSVAVDPVCPAFGTTPTRAFVVFGAPGTSTDRGAIWMYYRATIGSTGFGSPRKINVGSAQAVTGDRFGEAVDINDNWIIVGAPGSDGGKGAAWLVERTAANTFALRTKITRPDLKEGDAFGSSVSIAPATSGTDMVISIGAPGRDATVDSIVRQNSGSVFTFRKLTTSLIPVFTTEHTAIVPKSGDQFGFSASSMSGLTAVGIPFNNDAGLDAGAVRILSTP